MFKKAPVIVKRERWLHKNKEAKISVEKGLDEAKRGKIRKQSVDLDAKESFLVCCFPKGG